jgi:hypothetical protein
MFRVTPRPRTLTRSPPRLGFGSASSPPELRAAARLPWTATAWVNAPSPSGSRTWSRSGVDRGPSSGVHPSACRPKGLRNCLFRRWAAVPPRFTGLFTTDSAFRRVRAAYSGVPPVGRRCSARLSASFRLGKLGGKAQFHGARPAGTRPAVPQQATREQASADQPEE